MEIRKISLSYIEVLRKGEAQRIAYAGRTHSIYIFFLGMFRQVQSEMCCAFECFYAHTREGAETFWHESLKRLLSIKNVITKITVKCFDAQTNVKSIENILRFFPSLSIY